MTTVVLIALFGAAGCLARYWMSAAVYALAGTSFPYGTLTVNVVGSFLIGLINEIGLRSAMIPPNIRIAATVGFLGGLTTFSTFSFETFRLLEEGQHLMAAGNALLNLVCCLFCTWLGMTIARSLV